MTRARKKGFSAHGFFPSRLNFIQDENPASRADGGLIRLRQLLPRFVGQIDNLSHARAMDFESRPIELHERAGPRVQRADLSFQFVHIAREVESPILFFHHRRVG